MQSLSVVAAPFILCSEAREGYDQKLFLLQVGSASTTAASSRSASPSAEVFPIHRSKTVAGIGVEGCAAGYSCDLAARDVDDAASLRRSKTSPGIREKDLGRAYPAGLVVRNTFLEFVDERPTLQMRRAKSEPSKSPLGTVSQTGAEVIPEATGVLEVRSILDPIPMLGSPEIPTVGSEKHHLGECRPCAFFWKPGSCNNGVDCAHCHLCDPSAKKRRQKERKNLIKTQGRGCAGDQAGYSAKVPHA